MTSSSVSILRSFRYLTFATAVWMSSGIGYSGYRYSIQDLSSFGFLRTTLPWGADLNDLGHVAGISATGNLLLFNGRTVADLGRSGNQWVRPNSINNQDQIVGSMGFGVTDPIMYGFRVNDGNIQSLIDPTGLRPNGEAFLITDEGWIYGSRFESTPIGPTNYLDSVIRNPLSREWTSFQGYWAGARFNHRREIAGAVAYDVTFSGVKQSFSHAAVYKDGGGDSVELVSVLGSVVPQSYTSADDVNDAGIVIGNTLFIGSAGRLAPVEDLKVPARVEAVTIHGQPPYRINDFNVATGYTIAPFVWSGGVMQDLDAVTDLSSAGLPTVGQPVTINDRGQILTYFQPAANVVSVRTFLLTPIPAPPGQETRLVNISARGLAVSGQSSVVAGFVLTGGSRRVLARSVGPGLGAFGVSGLALDPKLALYPSGAVTPAASNDSWGQSTDAVALAEAANRVGAFPLGAGSADAALLADLGAGAYTVASEAVSAGTGGTVLSEIYDASTGPGGGRLVNASMRLRVGTGDNLGVVGFVLAGGYPARVLIRAIGPGLAAFNVGDRLADPRVFLHRGKSPVLGNLDWGSASGFPLLASTTSGVGAFALADGTKDAALLVQLEPGAYTVHVDGQDGGSGVCLVEIYLLPEAR